MANPPPHPKSKQSGPKSQPQPVVEAPGVDSPRGSDPGANHLPTNADIAEAAADKPAVKELVFARDIGVPVIGMVANGTPVSTLKGQQSWCTQAWIDEAVQHGILILSTR